ncbi:unnamed protein product [Fraxinus pennsylvanica]|uniref:DUF7880 domain-containing protein n=1 Tax=Fraxinus pennsylvanica TaxID=56036 RepID=A0AAD1YT15_9LAMI|nr:unnamed protein product [Fraxinus pennsylvanica]
MNWIRDLTRQSARNMAVTTTTVSLPAHVSFCSVFPSSRVSFFNLKQRRSVRCALFPPEARQSRRFVSLSLVFLNFLSLPRDAMGGSVLDKYLKKKKLDPLEAYIPAVILTELQIKDLGKFLEVDQPKFADCRNLLRSGPAASLRVNIRAVAQYASDAGNGISAFTNVDGCLRALEELDSLLLRASRNDSGASIKSMEMKIGTALDELDSLLKTVPTDVLEKGKAMADAYRTSEEDRELENLDPELKKLESIL